MNVFIETDIAVYKNMLWKSSLNTGHFKPKRGYIKDLMHDNNKKIVNVARALLTFTHSLE